MINYTSWKVGGCTGLGTCAGGFCGCAGSGMCAGGFCGFTGTGMCNGGAGAGGTCGAGGAGFGTLSGGKGASGLCRSMCYMQCRWSSVCHSCFHIYWLSLVPAILINICLEKAFFLIGQVVKLVLP